MHLLFALRDTHQPQDSIAAVRFADHRTQEHDVLLSLQVDTMDHIRDKRVLKFFSAFVEEPVAQLGHDTGLSSDSSLHVLDPGFSLVPRSSERSRSSDFFCSFRNRRRGEPVEHLLDKNCGASISQAVLLCNTLAGTDAEHHTTSDEPRNETDMFRSQTLLPGRLGLAVPIGLPLSPLFCTRSRHVAVSTSQEVQFPSSAGCT